jgi:hypothetical protein
MIERQIPASDLRRGDHIRGYDGYVVKAKVKDVIPDPDDPARLRVEVSSDRGDYPALVPASMPVLVRLPRPEV